MKEAYKQSAQLNKRKRGLLRKAMELSRLCGQQVFVAIGDPVTKTLTEFKSDQNHTFLDYDEFEVFDNGDYEDLEKKYVNNKKYAEIQNRHKHYLEQRMLMQLNMKSHQKNELISSDQVKRQIIKHPKSKKIQKLFQVVPKKRSSSELPVLAYFDFDRDFE